MKKRLSLLFALCILLSLCVPCFAAQNTAHADALHALGLFSGTDKGYELDKPMTREQGVVMIIRLLGKEAEAKAKNLKHPFTDLRGYAWADPYVGYAYENGITKGVSDDAFGYGEPMTDAMFLTMLLRILGYTDKDNGKGDFTWREPRVLANTIGLSEGEAPATFLRDDMVLACWNALSATRKGGSGLLAADLIRDGVFPAEAYTAVAGSYDGPTPQITLVSPTGTVDTVHPKLRDYLTRAKAQYTRGDYAKSAKADGEKFAAIEPVAFGWKCTNPEAVAGASIQLSLSKDFSDYRTVPCAKFDAAAEAQSEPVYNLFTGADYYWRVAVTLPNGETVTSEPMTFKTQAGPRVLSIAGVSNARDLGGKPTVSGKVTPEGRVYRAARLETATEAGVQTIVKELGIKTEIDLRNPNSTSEPPMTSLEKTPVRYYNYSGKHHETFIAEPENATQALRVFANPEAYPILFHCHGGADRTGAIAFILNALAGVPEAELIMDYEITSNRYVTGYVSGSHTYNFPALLEAFHALEGSTTQEKARSFLKSAKLSSMEIYNIEALIATDAAVFKKAPTAPVAAKGGTVAYQIDPRTSGAIRSVKQGGSDLPFTFEDGKLTVTVQGSGEAEVLFEDGAKLPIEWKETK